MSKRNYEKLTGEDYEQALDRSGKGAAQLMRGKAVFTDRYEGETPIAVNRSYITYADYIRFTHMAISFKIKAFITFWSLVSIAMGAAILFVKSRERALGFEALFLSLVLLFFGFIILIYFFRVMPQRTASSYVKDDAAHKGLDGEAPYREYYFYEEGMTTKTSDGRGNSFPYTLIRKCYESDDLFAFTISLQNGYLLKKDSFISGSLDMIRSRIEAAVQANKGLDKQEMRRRR